MRLRSIKTLWVDGLLSQGNSALPQGLCSLAIRAFKPLLCKDLLLSGPIDGVGGLRLSKDFAPPLANE